MQNWRKQELRPRYWNARLSNYGYLGEVGRSEAADPYYFGASLVRRIRETPGQEIATHTLSHFYCLEEGATPEAFEADLGAAIALAGRQQVALRSIVFPRNQYAPAYLENCRRLGLRAFRGTPPGWAYRPEAGAGQTQARRALRLLDAHTGVLGHLVQPMQAGTFRDVPASRFLRPCAGRLAALHPFHVSTIRRGMTRAASTGQRFHLWWHFNSFGARLDANMAALGTLVAHFARLRDEGRMASRAMGDAA